MRATTSLNDVSHHFLGPYLGLGVGRQRSEEETETDWIGRTDGDCRGAAGGGEVQVGCEGC